MKIKKCISLLLILCLFCSIFSAVSVSAYETDTSGEIEYSFADGVLTLSGKGDGGLFL